MANILSSTYWYLSKERVSKVEEKDISFEEARNLLSRGSDFDPWGKVRMYALIHDGVHDLYIGAIKSLENLEHNAGNYTRIYLVSSDGFPLIGKA